MYWIDEIKVLLLKYSFVFQQNHQRHQQHQLPQRGKSLGKPGDDEKFVGSRGQAQLHRAVCEKLMGSRARSSRQKTSEV